MMYPHIMPKPAVPKNAAATMSQSGPQGMNQACAASPAVTRTLPIRIRRPSCDGASPDRSSAPAPHPSDSVTTTRPASSGVSPYSRMSRIGPYTRNDIMLSDSTKVMAIPQPTG